MKWKQTLKDLLRERGYLLAFAVCLAAVAVSGWLFVRSLRDTDDELIVPDPAEAVQAAVLPTLPDVRGAERADAQAPARPVRPIHPAVPEIEETETPTTEHASTTKPAPQPAALRVRPVDGTVLQGYSVDKLRYNATTRDWRTHAGMDLAAPAGSEVRAAAAGTVLTVYEDELLGQTVTLEHPGGWVTHYANLDPELRVSAGDKVEAGQVLGLVGKTALVEVGDAPHLHFAVYKNNVPQDPEAFLAG